MGTHNFPKLWVLLFHQIPILWLGKSSKSTHWGKPEKLVPILFPKCGSFKSDSQVMVCFITREIHWYTHQYPMVLEKALKPILWEEPRKLVSILSPKYGWFSYIKFPLYGPQGKRVGLPIDIP